MKKVLLVILMFVIIILVGVVALQLIALKYTPSIPINKELTLTPKSFTTSTTSTTSNSETPQPLQLPARLALESAQNFVKERKLPPTEAARLYAYVATAYFDTLQNTKDTLLAIEASKTIISHIYPLSSSNPTTSLTSTTKTTTSITSTVTSTLPRDPLVNRSSKLDSLQFFQDLLTREKNDGFHSLIWNGKIPKGPGLWKGENPITPRAGDWQRWLIPQNTTFTVAPPPEFGGAEYQTEINKVTQAVAQRTTDQEKRILFWAGGPGSETPSGIWQNKLWELFQKKYEKESPSSNLDLKYAYLQKILAQGLADSFMECWKIKFTYWTARPTMVIKDLETFIPTPRFPSYTSGHATISRTAAEILGSLFPQEKMTILQAAEEARDTRLWSGIHFDIDNKEGFKLGEQIGKEVIKHIGIME